MIFEYINEESGVVIERDFPFGTTPPSEVTHEGVTYRRYWSSMNIVYGASFNTEGQVKFKRPPLESENYEYT